METEEGGFIVTNVSWPKDPKPVFGIFGKRWIAEMFKDLQRNPDDWVVSIAPKKEKGTNVWTNGKPLDKRKKL